MVRVPLSERQWSKIEAFLRSERGAGRPTVYVQTFMVEDHAGLSAKPAASCRISRTGTGTGTRTTDRENRDSPLERVAPGVAHVIRRGR